jgi:hypothetical protein
MDEIIPLHAGDVGEMLSVMPRERLALLNDLLGELRDALHGREKVRNRSVGGAR